MKILHTADWHIGQFKGPVVDGVNLRSQDTVKCLEYMVQVAIEEKPDIVCVSGDIFHQEQVGPVRYSDEMITATNIITSLAHFSKYVIVMRGTPNHDGAAQFRVLERMLLNIRNVDVVTEPGVIKTPWADIACLPGFDKQEFRAKFPGLSADEENLAWTKYISDMVFALRAECEKTPILMAHYTVPGCNMESGQTSFFTNFEPVIPREALIAARYEAVLLGHIHRPQIIEGFDNVFYSGAINAMNFNDEGQDRGFWIHEFNEKGTLVKGHRYTTPYRQFHTITCSLRRCHMKLVANKPCTLSGKRYFIGEEIPAEAVADPVALEKMGVLTVIRDGIPVETLEECVTSVGEVFFKIEIVKGDKGFDLDVTEPQLQEAVKTMQMNQKDAVAHIRDTVEDNTVLIFLNAVDSRTAVKKEAETKAKSLGELEESAGDA